MNSSCGKTSDVHATAQGKVYVFDSHVNITMVVGYFILMRRHFYQHNIPKLISSRCCSKYRSFSNFI